MHHVLPCFYIAIFASVINPSIEIINRSLRRLTNRKLESNLYVLEVFGHLTDIIHHNEVLKLIPGVISCQLLWVFISGLNLKSTMRLLK